MSGGGDQTIHSLPRADSYGSTNPPVEQLRLTARDQELLRECQQESLQQRCAPFAALAGGLTHFAVKSGKLPPNPQFGPWPKVAAAVLAGYILGKLSYIPVAKEKFKADPLSEIGRQLREKEGGYVERSPNPAPEAYSATPDGPAPPTTPSYDDIRKRNRTAVGTGVVGRTPPLPPPPRESEPELPPLNTSDYDYGQVKDPIDQPSRIRRPRRRVNAYGDELEDV